MPSTVISAIGWLSGLLTMVPAVAGWLPGAPVPLAFLAINGVKLVPVALAALPARRYRWGVDDLHLRVGSLRAGWWPVLGPVLCLLVPALFLTDLPPGALNRLPAALPWLPVFLAGALINSSAEEFLYRVTALRALHGAVPVVPAVLFTSMVFGVGHLDGNPGGWLGAAGATLFGLACALAMLRARGYCWNLVMHLFADFSIVLSLTLAQLSG